MARIVSLHGVLKKIVSDRGSQFTSRFWKSFHENMDTKLNFSSAYQPQTDGQTERTNQVLEDMLRACALKHGGSWDKSLPYADVHDVFHVSQLKKCLRVPEEQLPMEDLSVQEDLFYVEYPIKILDTLTRVTRNKVIKMCKVQWSHHGEDEATWEREVELRIDFPHLFSRSS
jgi:transposase InsO family protein